MKKLIIIEDNSKIQIGDVVKLYNQFTNKWQFGIVKEVDYDGYSIELSTFEASIFHPKENKDIQKVQLYIVDTKATVKNGIDWCINNNEDTLYIPNNLVVEGVEYWNKIVTTSTPKLNLPQLSHQAIKLIVEKNGELGEFDVEIKTRVKSYKDSPEGMICTQCSTYIFDDCNCPEEIEIANIIPKSNATKEYYIKNIYSEDEVKALTFKAMQDITSLHCLPKITDITEWFENNKKK